MIRGLLFACVGFLTLASAGCGCSEGKVSGGGGCAAGGTCGESAEAVPGFHAAAGTVQSPRFRLTGTLSHLDRGTRVSSSSASLVGRASVPGGGR